MTGGWYGTAGWWIKVGDWSFGWHQPGERRWRPLSERYGSTRSWWLGGFCLRRHGRIEP